MAKHNRLFRLNFSRAIRSNAKMARERASDFPKDLAKRHQAYQVVRRKKQLAQERARVKKAFFEQQSECEQGKDQYCRGAAKLFRRHYGLIKTFFPNPSPLWRPEDYQGQTW